MSSVERAELHAAVEKVKMEIGVLFLNCQRARALRLGVKVQMAFTVMNDAEELFEIRDMDAALPESAFLITPKELH